MTLSILRSHLFGFRAQHQNLKHSQTASNQTKVFKISLVDRQVQETVLLGHSALPHRRILDGRLVDLQLQPSWIQPRDIDARPVFWGRILRVLAPAPELEEQHRIRIFGHAGLRSDLEPHQRLVISASQRNVWK